LLVALVEDNASSRVFMESLLDPPFQVRSYPNGEEALRGFETEAPDLVLLDISLPDLNGTEVLRRMRAMGTLRTTPAIAISAHAMAGDRDKFLAAGFDACFSKPVVDPLELLRSIRRLTAARP
jgi:CheY-like chemotaxis protein